MYNRGDCHTDTIYPHDHLLDAQVEYPASRPGDKIRWYKKFQILPDRFGILYHLSADDRTDWFGAGPVHGIRLSDRADAGLRCAGEDAFADIDLKPVLRHDDHHRRTLEDDDIEYELRVGRNDRRYAGNKSG